jgi:hypothetical protein
LTAQEITTLQIEIREAQNYLIARDHWAPIISKIKASRAIARIQEEIAREKCAGLLE